jgi:hypothetical protein
MPSKRIKKKARIAAGLFALKRVLRGLPATTAAAAATTAAIATATAATAAIATATAAAAAARTILCFINAKRATAHAVAVQCLDRTGRILLRHFNETETALAACFAINREGHRFDISVLSEQRTYGIFICGKGQVAHINFCHLWNNSHKQTK